jgi:hypothetical protein
VTERFVSEPTDPQPHEDDDEQSDPGGDSDVEPDPARNPEVAIGPF